MNPTSALRRRRPAKFAILALALAAVANTGCSKHDPSKDEILSRANDAFAAGKYAEAEKAYRDVLQLTPADPVAVRQLGIIYSDRGQLLAAYPLLKKAAELEPDNLEVQLKLGQTLLAARDIRDARAAALRILDKQPTNDQALILLGETAIVRNDIDEVQKLLEGLREKDQGRAAYHVASGTLALRQKDEARAEEEFKAAIAADPKLAVAHAALGNLYWSRNDLKSADESFKAATNLAPPRSITWLQYADFKLRIGATTDAEKILADITG
jgi:predicted Zn-dependent protease